MNTSACAKIAAARVRALKVLAVDPSDPTALGVIKDAGGVGP